MSTTIDRPAVAGAASPQSSPQPGVIYYAYRVAKAFASLQLTVVLFAFSILLVFFGTMAQIDNGIWTVVDKYFWSWAVMVPFDLFHKFGNVFLAEQFPKDTAPWNGSFPLPGGKLLGGLMLINLLAAHALRFKLRWKRSGIILVHSGLILLFVGEFITREYAIEQRMTIDEGASVGYAEDSRHYELAFTDHSGSTEDRVTVIPATMLRHAAGRITHPDLPVDIEVVKYMPNSRTLNPDPSKKNLATAGLAVKPETAAIAVEAPEVSGVDPNQKIDMPAAYITLLKKGTDQSLGTYLVSLLYSLEKYSNWFEIEGKKYDCSLRLKRYYKPFRIELVKFRFDRYPGTQKPKNYSSDVIVYDETGNEVRRQTIRMNEPLRYEGETFYQSSFDERTETTTILQVVKNPGWVIPYVSCVMVGLGLVLHFMIGLIAFARKLGSSPGGLASALPAVPSAPTEAMTTRWFDRNMGWVVPAALVGIAALYLGSVYGRMKPKDEFNLDAFSKLPVLEGGRVKPLDSVARVYLRKISHQAVYKDENGDEHPAIRWYLETLGAKPSDKNEPAWSYRVIRIESDQVLAELKLPLREGLRYSFNELRDHLGDLDKKGRDAFKKRKEKKTLDIFETKLLDLLDKLELLFHIAAGRGHDTSENAFHLVPPQAEGKPWVSLGEFRASAEAGANDAATLSVRQQLRAQPGGFDEERLLKEIFGSQATQVPPERRKIVVDMIMNSDPAMLPPDGRSEVFGMLLSMLPKPEQDAAHQKLEADIASRLQSNPAVVQWEKLIETCRAKKPEQFNALLDEYRTKYLNHVAQSELRHTGLEIQYNRFSPFLRCIGLYVMAFVISVLGFAFKAAEWPQLGEAFRKSALLLLLLTLLLHLGGLIVRMDLMGRWTVFVTNLYSSAIFIGAGCVALGLLLELVFPIGIANIVGSVLGVATTIVAHNIATEDTLEMMQAVLDTNFWLATHVTTVTLGYTATFVAGFLAVAFLFLMFCTVIRNSFREPGQPTPDRLFAYGAAAAGIAIIPLSIGWVLFDALGKFEVLPSVLCELLRYAIVAIGGVYFIILLGARAAREGVDSHGMPIAGPVPTFARPLASMSLDPHIMKILGQMIYGVLCFATMLSFIGTVLGGIWADQSWGRFWGWDPKENGAVLIVLWNALILHARWCGLVKTRGMAVLAVVGNMITAWSWFGTNQLGIGLHAYGFDTRLADGCFNFWLSMGMILLLGLIPLQYWNSATGRAANTPAPEQHLNGARPQGEKKMGRKRR